jgi:hypothetical protein
MKYYLIIDWKFEGHDLEIFEDKSELENRLNNLYTIGNTYSLRVIYGTEWFIKSLKTIIKCEVVREDPDGK